jgi:hypothetical protein
VIPRVSESALRLAFLLFILASSVQTLIKALSNPPVVALATVEIAAAAALAVERSRRIAAVALVGVFAIAFVASALSGEFAPRFIFFAATALYLAGRDQQRASAREQ